MAKTVVPSIAQSSFPAPMSLTALIARFGAVILPVRAAWRCGASCRLNHGAPKLTILKFIGLQRRTSPRKLVVSCFGRFWTSISESHQMSGFPVNV